MNGVTDVQTAVATLEASREFQEFNIENPHHYLVHAFATSAGQATPLEFGYYGKESDRITVFKTEPILRMPSDEVFKQSGVLQALDLAAVRLGLPEVLALAEQERASAYPQHPMMKAICVLQQQDAPTWNITLVTGTLQMINMRFSAADGSLLTRSISSIMEIAKE